MSVSKTTDLLFHVGMIVKGIDSVFEVIGGILLTMPTNLARYISVISEHEAFRHHAVLAGRLDKIADSVVMHPSMVEAAYLAVHGLAKVILIAAIVAHKRWGYVGLIVVLSLFSVIELVRAGTAREIVTFLFGLLDVFVVVLIYKEYRARFASSETT
jgi:uncharacterized membrane protein